MGAKDVVTGRLLGSSDKFSGKQVQETLHMLVAHATAQHANTIHIEPQERGVVVRYRIDGALHGVHKLPMAALDPLLEQLKELADIELDQTAMPQEGTFVLTIEHEPVNIRLSTMPVLGGERAVLHLMPQIGQLGTLQQLGLWGAALSAVQQTLARAHGLVLVSGPKHSGKTTTLYSLLQLVNNPAHSIATVEEHPTHRLPNVAHAYVHGARGLADGLQAVLRQDPNVVLVGGLPNHDAAELAVHAAVTGHLLLAELHADSAVANLIHLRALGVEPFLLASSLRLSIGQRLVRRLCMACRERYNPETSELTRLDKQFGIHTQDNHARLHQLDQMAHQSGIGSETPLGSSPSAITHLWRANPDGCKACNHTGYKGRLGLFEVLTNSENLQHVVMRSDLPKASDIHKTALQDGFVPLGLDGLIKALRGQTTIAEVLRALPNR